MSDTTNGKPRVWPRWTTGDRLRKARQTAGLTQIQLASAIKMSPRTVVEYEQDVRPPRYGPLFGWATVCSVDVEFLDPDGIIRSGFRCTPEAPDQTALAA